MENTTGRGLTEIEAIAGALLDGRLQITASSLSGPACRTMTAWQEVMFSPAGDDSVRRYFNFQLEGITKISDTLYPHQAPGQEGTLALNETLLSLITHLQNRYAPFFNERAFVPRSYYQKWRGQHDRQLISFDRLVRSAGISTDLKDCLTAYTAQFGPVCTRVRYDYRGLQYLETFIAELSGIDWFGPGAEERLEDALLRLNFNHLKYFAYCQRRVAALGRKRELLQARLLKIAMTPEQTRIIYHPEWQPLRIMLAGYLREELLFCQDSPGQDRPATKKLVLNLTVAQIACLVRLLFDEGVFASANLQEIFRFFCLHFSSSKQKDMSAGSLSKESYSATQKTAATMRGLLSRVIARINRTFFPD